MDFLLALRADERFAGHLCQDFGLRWKAYPDGSHLAFPRLQDCVARNNRHLWTSNGKTRRVPRHRGVCGARLVGGIFPRSDGRDVRDGVC